MIIISVKCDEGWSFKGGSTATVNGSSGLRSTATLSDPATALTEKRYAFEATCMISPEQILNDMALTVEAPEAGKKPSTAAVSQTEGVKVKSVSWSPADTTFKSGTEYTVTIEIAEDGDKAFAESVVSTFLRQYRTILSAQMRSNFFVRRYKESDQLLRNCGRVPPLSRIFREDELQATQTEKGQADACLRL